MKKLVALQAFYALLFYVCTAGFIYSLMMITVWAVTTEGAAVGLLGAVLFGNAGVKIARRMLAHHITLYQARKRYYRTTQS